MKKTEKIAIEGVWLCTVCRQPHETYYRAYHCCVIEKEGVN